MSEALLIVDYQNDFTPPDGALAVPGGEEIAEHLNQLAASDRFDMVVATRDWHPPDHRSFEAHGGPWPAHCVQGTEGAELHPALDRERVHVILDKGQDPNTEGYSAFERPDLGRLLGERGIDSVYVAGLATNICVHGTALDALREGLSVTVDTRASRGVEFEEGAVDRAIEELREAGAEIV